MVASWLDDTVSGVIGHYSKVADVGSKILSNKATGAEIAKTLGIAAAGVAANYAGAWVGGRAMGGVGQAINVASAAATTASGAIIGSMTATKLGKGKTVGAVIGGAAGALIGAGTIAAGGAGLERRRQVRARRSYDRMR
jgi:hypothetical protein